MSHPPRRAPRFAGEGAAVVCCKNCGVPLGFSDGRTLYVATVFFMYRVALPCQGCGHVTLWKSKEAPNGHPR